MYLDDEFRTTVCPHEAFAANDGKNNFKVHNDAYLSSKKPETKCESCGYTESHDPNCPREV